MDLNLTDKKEDRDLDRLIMDDQLDKLYQAFNDYKKERSMDEIDPKDFVDNYFAQNNATNYDYLHYDAQSTIIQISRDFEVFERTELRPPTNKTPILDFNNNIDQLGENVHEFERMVEEMDSGTWPCSVACYEGDGSGGVQLISGMASGSSNNDAQSSTIIMQISKDFEAFERTKLPQAKETLVDFSNNMDPLGEDVDETERMIEEMTSQYTSSYAHPSYNVFGCYNNVVNMACYDIANDSSGPIIRYFFCGQTKNMVKTNNHRRKRQKRKYRGVVMSEEQRLVNMAKQKIKNREVAARTHEMRLAREAHLESQRMELLKQNDFLKKMVTFLEDHKRVNMRCEPLRRTISGPLLIQ